MMVGKENSGSPASAATTDPTEGLSAYEPWAIDPARPKLFDAPLEFIFSEHRRQRQAALTLNLIADGEFNETGLGALIRFLEGDFALHVGDEELGLFPILRQNCRPEDNIDQLIERLVGEHKNDESLSDDIINRLKALQRNKTLNEDDKRKIRAFAEHIRQHLAVENAVLLPIARVRMNASALEALADILKDRHRKA